MLLENRDPIREDVFHILRKTILNGDYQPGERLMERELGSKFGISRTPIREAIRKLEQEGLVIHIPRKGVVVKNMSNKDIMEIFTIRSALEGVATRLATENITAKEILKLKQLLDKMSEASNAGDYDKAYKIHTKFNDIIYSASSSPRLYQMIKTFEDYIKKYTLITYRYPERRQQSNREHHGIIEAMANHDGTLAEKIAREHIEHTKLAYLNTINDKKLSRD